MENGQTTKTFLTLKGTFIIMNSDFGTVDSAVASDTRGPGFESATFIEQ